MLLSAGSQDKFGHKVLLNQGAGRFDPQVPLGHEHPAPESRGALAVDLDGDGALELLVTRAGAGPALWQAPPPKDRHWLEVLPARPDGGPKTRGLDALADGLVVEVKSGHQLQVGGIITSPGYLGALPRQVHFGLGEHTKADYVRLSWADGVFQSELEIAADHRWLVPKSARNDHGEDVLEHILKIDRRYVEPPVDPRFVGYARDHWVELDFGDRLQKLDPTNGLVLYHGTPGTSLEIESRSGRHQGQCGA